MTPPSRSLAFGGSAAGGAPGASPRFGQAPGGSLVGAGVNEIRAVS